LVVRLLALAAGLFALLGITLNLVNHHFELFYYSLFTFHYSLLLDFFQLLTSQPRQLHRIFHPEQRIKSRAYYIMRIR